MFDFLKRQSAVLVGKYRDINNINTSIFKNIVGYDDYKILLTKAVKSPYKINIMLCGAAGTGKSEYLKEIERNFKGKTVYIDGASTMTKAGLRDIMFKNGSKTKFLLVDEINLLKTEDMGIFLSLAQDNKITVTMKNTYKILQLYNLKIIGTCNFIPDNKKIALAINDRFDIYRFKQYNYDQLMQIALFRLKGIIRDRNLIEYVVNRVYYDLKSRSMRDIMDIANLDLKSAEEVDHYINTKLEN